MANAYQNDLAVQTAPLSVIQTQEVLGKDFSIYGTLTNPLFLAKDVATWIEHSNTSRMLENIDEDEKVIVNTLTLTKCYSEQSNGKHNKWFLTEHGLYEVLMQSRKPVAKQFKKEVKRILKELRLGVAELPAATSPPPPTPEMVTIEKRRLDILELTSAMASGNVLSVICQREFAKLLDDDKDLHRCYWLLVAILSRR